jgi:hypothetical protein
MIRTNDDPHFNSVEDDEGALRADSLTPIGREFARQHDLVGTPTFVLFDGTGREIKRWQQPPSASELEA